MRTIDENLRMATTTQRPKQELGMETAEAAHTLAALANDARLNIFRTLIKAQRHGATGGMAAGALGAALDMSPSSLSFHLKDLRFAGLVRREREGRNVIYRANVDTLNALLGFLVNDCCGGRPDLCVRPISATTPAKK